MRSLLLLVIITVLLLGGTAIAYVSGATAVFLFFLTDNAPFLAALPRRIFSQMDVFAFMAMPLFILVGELMNRGGVTNALVDFAMSLIGRMRGGLGHVNILTSVFFAGISGSAIADAAALSNTLVPAMKKQGYSETYAGAITAASAIIGPIIPPSIILIFYGAIMGVDVAALFAAGLIPGFLLALVLIVANGYFAWRHGHPGGKDLVLEPISKTFVRALPALALPLIIMVGIVLGWMTPTEAAAVAVFAALGVSASYGTLNRDMIVKSIWRTIVLSGAIFVALAAGSIVNFLATLTMVPNMLAEWVQALSLEGNVFLLVLMMVFILMGMLAETQIALILIAPLLVPIAVMQGADPVHIGVVVCLNLAMGLITPPLGGAILVTSTVTRVNYWVLVRATLPFMILELVLLAVLVLVPELTIYLPTKLGLM